MSDIYKLYRYVKMITKVNENIEANVGTFFAGPEDDYKRHSKYPVKKNVRENISSHESIKVFAKTKLHYRIVGRSTASRIHAMAIKRHMIREIPGRKNPGSEHVEILDDGYKLIDGLGLLNIYYEEWTGGYKLLALILPPSVLIILIKFLPVAFHFIFS